MCFMMIMLEQAYPAADRNLLLSKRAWFLEEFIESLLNTYCSQDSRIPGLSYSELEGQANSLRT